MNQVIENGLLFSNFQKELGGFVREDINEIALYYKVNKYGGGFDFYSFNYVSGIIGDITFEDSECYVSVLFKGYALFDGIRHIYLEPESQGYVYYPNLKSMISVLERLNQLQEKYCDL